MILPCQGVVPGALSAVRCLHTLVTSMKISSFVYGVTVGKYLYNLKIRGALETESKTTYLWRTQFRDSRWTSPNYSRGFQSISLLCYGTNLKKRVEPLKTVLKRHCLFYSDELGEESWAAMYLQKQDIGIDPGNPYANEFVHGSSWTFRSCEENNYTLYNFKNWRWRYSGKASSDFWKKCKVWEDDHWFNPSPKRAW